MMNRVVLYLLALSVIVFFIENRQLRADVHQLESNQMRELALLERFSERSDSYQRSSLKWRIMHQDEIMTKRESILLARRGK